MAMKNHKSPVHGHEKSQVKYKNKIILHGKV